MYKCSVHCMNLPSGSLHVVKRWRKLVWKHIKPRIWHLHWRPGFLSRPIDTPIIEALLLISSDYYRPSISSHRACQHCGQPPIATLWSRGFLKRDCSRIFIFFRPEIFSPSFQDLFSIMCLIFQIFETTRRRTPTSVLESRVATASRKEEEKNVKKTGPLKKRKSGETSSRASTIIH